jgi:hypothetical protein
MTSASVHELSPAQEEVTSVRQAASVCGVSPFVLRGWIRRGLLAEPPWTLDQVQEVWGLTKTDEEWSRALDIALTATHRDDLKNQRRVCRGLCLQGLQGVPARADGQESRLTDDPTDLLALALVVGALVVTA